MWIEKVINKSGRVSYKARIERHGLKLTKTFSSRSDANKWGVQQESNLIVAKKTFYDLIDVYRPYAEALKGSQSALSRLRSLKNNLPDIPLIDFSKTTFDTWKSKRSTEVSAGSLCRESGVLRKMFRLAEEEFHWVSKNPIPKISRPKVEPRARGISEGEIAQILQNLKNNKHGKQLTTMFLLAIETGMRLSEILNLTWANVHEKYVHLPDTKNGDERNVPLSPIARILMRERIGYDEEKVFTLSAHVASQNFRRNSGGIHFHDARSEAITRLSKILNIYDMAKMIGHRDYRSLLHYYKEDVIEMADKL